MTTITAQPLEPLLKSTLLPLYAQQLQTVVTAEQRKRAAFYEWLTEDTKAEFINGEIIVQSPAKDRHTHASMNLSFLLSSYVAENDLGVVVAERALVRLTRNDYFPDICFFGTEKARGITLDQMKYPAPDLVVEILSPSTAQIDRGTKFEDYAAHDVREYWLIDPQNLTVEQYVLRDGSYELLFKVGSGDLSSEVVKGFTIPVQAIFDRKLANRVLVEMIG